MTNHQTIFRLFRIFWIVCLEVRVPSRSGDPVLHTVLMVLMIAFGILKIHKWFISSYNSKQDAKNYLFRGVNAANTAQ